jgi:putative spermidine/putrescine transport system substrate-binding protein
MSSTRADRRRGTSRRQVLRGAAAAAGAAIGSGALRGFPTIWAQNIKDVTMIHIGLSAIVIKQIGDQATEDLGFTMKTQAVDPASQLQRLLTQPKSLDINECYASTNKYLEGKGVLKPIAVKDYKLWDKTPRCSQPANFPTAGQSRTRGCRRYGPGSGTGPTAKSSPADPATG